MNGTNGLNYYNSGFAKYDTICGFGTDYETNPVTQYQSHYQAPACNGGGDDPKTGSITVDNGAINIKVPMVYTFPYDASQGKFSGCQKKGKSKGPQNCKKPLTKVRPRSLSRGRKQTGESSSCVQPPLPPFCATFKKGYVAPPISKCRSGDAVCDERPYGRNKTSMKWDFDARQKIPIRKVDYGEELYENLADKIAEKLIQDRLDKMATAAQTSSEQEQSNTCRDFSVPKFNSSKKITDELAHALNHLNRLPAEMEQLFLSDKRFEPLILNRVPSSIMDCSKDERVFKNLVPVEPNASVQERVSKTLSDQILAVRPPSRSKDPAPNLLEYQEQSFTRIKPKTFSQDPEPQAGVSVDVTKLWEYQMIEAERKAEDAADKMDD